MVFKASYLNELSQFVAPKNQLIRNKLFKRIKIEGKRLVFPKLLLLLK